jgi:hypothetical protein
MTPKKSNPKPDNSMNYQFIHRLAGELLKIEGSNLKKWQKEPELRGEELKSLAMKICPEKYSSQLRQRLARQLCAWLYSDHRFNLGGPTSQQDFTLNLSGFDPRTGCPVTYGHNQRPQV